MEIDKLKLLEGEIFDNQPIRILIGLNEDSEKMKRLV